MQRIETGVRDGVQRIETVALEEGRHESASA